MEHAKRRQTWCDDLKIAYSDDPDPDHAGHGMVCFPLVKQTVSPHQNMLSWWMSPAEQSAILFIVEHLRPKLSIEIGTQFGGSLQAIAKYSDHVYSIDSDANIPKQLDGYFQNVEYLTGYSDRLLPQLVDTMQKTHAPLSFVLIDGGHSTDEVRKDINHLLKFHPTSPLYILMHDSFNPDCRKGMRTANWADNPYIHAVELDFVVGIITAPPSHRNQMWGGLALAILLPEERKGRFEITARAELMFQAASRAVFASLPRRAAGHARRFVGHLPMMRKLHGLFSRSIRHRQ
jgi:hypothetical protein